MNILLKKKNLVLTYIKLMLHTYGNQSIDLQCNAKICNKGEEENFLWFQESASFDQRLIWNNISSLEFTIPAHELHVHEIKEIKQGKERELTQRKWTK